MYFKVEKGVPLWEELEKIMNQIIHVRAEAYKLVEELGFTTYAPAHNVVAGGISALHCNFKPEGFREVGERWRNLYFPKAKNKVASEKIANLPVVQYDEYNSVIGFTEHFVGLTHIMCYGLKKSGDVFLIKMHEKAEYTPIDGMIEILPSEYKMWIDAIGDSKTDE